MADTTAERGEIAVVGAGSWGTALSIVLGKAGWRVRLWARRAEIAAAVQSGRRNPAYLPEFEFPRTVEATADLRDAVAGARMVVLAVPSDGVGEVCERLADCMQDDQGLISAAKGLEHETGRRLSEVIEEALGPGRQGRIAVLSGPNLAPEVAAEIATASVVACADLDFAAGAQAALSTPRFRVYTNRDVLGVELGGALKNIIAIGAGASDGLGFGDNTKAALMTRGLVEMTRLGVALGARQETFRGLSGMGDLIATCASRKSRNYHVGFEIARGRNLADVLAKMSQVAEGVGTTRAALALATRANVDMPITAAVHSVLFEGARAMDAVQQLMARSWRDELD